MSICHQTLMMWWWLLCLPDYSFPVRIGRTGRFGRSGIAINFVDGQRSMRNMQEIEKHFGKPIVKLDTADYDNMEQAVA